MNARMAASLLLLLAALPLAAQNTPPAPGKSRPVHFPKASEKTLPNGLRVIVIPKHEMPLAAARLLIRTGGAADPAGLAGLADVTASLMTKGTKTSSATQIANAIEALGGSLESGASWDGSQVDVTVLSSELPAALGIVSDVVRHPAFSAEELQRLREQTLDDLQVRLRQPASVAKYVASRLIFGTTPYGHALGGLPESLKKITPADVARFHKTWYRPDNAILLIGGDVTPASGFAIAAKAFGSWQSVGPKKSSAAASSTYPAPRKVVIDLPGSGQAVVLAGRTGLRRSDPEYTTALVANSVLGGGYSSRLNQEIRIKRGLSYGAGSSFDARRLPGSFTASAQTKNESAPEVAAILIAELGRMGSETVTAQELTPRKATLIGDFGREVETNSGLVGSIGFLALMGLKLDQINHYVEQVEGVGTGDVQKFAGRALQPESLNLVIVGDAAKFIEPLKKQYPSVEVIPIDQLDLSAPDLRKK